MKKLAILGASGHGKVVAEIAELNGWQVSFFDDAWPEIQQIESWEVKGATDDLLENIKAYAGVMVAIGNNQARYNKFLNLQIVSSKFISLIHPKAVVSNYAKIGRGTVVMAGAIINPFAMVGLGCIVNTAATIDHDCKLGDCVHISPGVNLAGAVLVGDLSWIGIGAIVKQCVEVGSSVMVGAGAVVVKDVIDNSVVVGIPAR